MSRRSSGPELTVISWRDIPAQVTARAGDAIARVELPAPFQAAIDRAAMTAGLAGTEDYLDEWVRSSRPCGDAVEEEARAEAERIVSDFPVVRLRRLAEAGGIDTDAGTGEQRQGGGDIRPNPRSNGNQHI